MKPIWSTLHLIFFRFVFIFFILWASPWNWLPYVDNWLSEYAYYPAFWVRNYLLHPNESPVWTHAPTGSGDTYDDWLLTWVFLMVSIFGTVVWTLADRLRKEYITLDYWFRVFLRYYLAMVLFSYGFHKIFPHQMPFPNLAQLHTPLGDLSPMRLAWLFIGYSTPYEFFSGLMESLAALFLIFRRTQLLGSILAANTLFNVVMFNYCYDIPVKLFSTQLFLFSCYLIAHDRERLFSFFFKSTPSPAPDYGPSFQSIPLKILRYSLFLLFAGYYLVYGFYNEYKFNRELKTRPVFELYGAYEVKRHLINQAEINGPTDTIRWNQIIMGNGFNPNQSYGMVKRGTYLVDRTIQTIDSAGGAGGARAFNITFRDDTLRNFIGRFERINQNEIQLNGIARGDTIQLDLSRINKPFKLETRPFHWVSATPY